MQDHLDDIYVVTGNIGYMGPSIDVEGEIFKRNAVCISKSTATGKGLIRGSRNQMCSFKIEVTPVTLP